MRRSAGQVRAVMGGVYALDFGSILMLAHATGALNPLLVDVLPEIAALADEIDWLDLGRRAHEQAPAPSRLRRQARRSRSLPSRAASRPFIAFLIFYSARKRSKRFYIRIDVFHVAPKLIKDTLVEKILLMDRSLNWHGPNLQSALSTKE
jgi:hypothetical protein